MNEQVFEQRGTDGALRRGVVSVPEVSNGIAVVLLPAGLKYRVGAGRMNVRLARRLATAGFVVLRFDPLGIGESEGRLTSRVTADLWSAIAHGQWIQDSLRACHQLRSDFGCSAVVSGGLCGGAITAQLAAAAEPGAIQGVISLGTAVTYPAVDGPAIAEIAQSIAQHHTRSYLRKLTSAMAWGRLLSGESDYRGIFSVLKSYARGLKRRGAESAPLRFPNENPLFLPTFRTLQNAGVEHLLIFGSSDNRWLEFQDAVLTPKLGGLRKGLGYEVHVIDEANHEMFLACWKDLVETVVEHWLTQRFLPSATGSVDETTGRAMAPTLHVT